MTQQNPAHLTAWGFPTHLLPLLPALTSYLLVLGPHLSLTGTKHRPVLGNADASWPRQNWNSPVLEEVTNQHEGWRLAKRLAGLWILEGVVLRTREGEKALFIPLGLCLYTFLNHFPETVLITPLRRLYELLWDWNEVKKAQEGYIVFLRPHSNWVIW